MHKGFSQLELRAMAERLRAIDTQLQAIRTGSSRVAADEHWALLREKQAIKATLQSYSGADGE